MAFRLPPDSRLWGRPCLVGVCGAGMDTSKLPSLGCPSLRPSLQGSPIGLFFFLFFNFFFFFIIYFLNRLFILVNTESVLIPVCRCRCRYLLRYVHRYLGRYLTPSLRPNFLRVRSQAKVELTASDWLNES